MEIDNLSEREELNMDTIHIQFQCKGCGVWLEGSLENDWFVCLACQCDEEG